MQKFGPVPEAFAFGDGIDWSSPRSEVLLYVELPFWLMVDPGPVSVSWSDTEFSIEICSPWMEAFIEEVTDSRSSCYHHGPLREDWTPPPAIAAELESDGVAWMTRPCKTVLRLKAMAHDDAFRVPRLTERPRVAREHEAYWSSLCEAHIPVVNELIQRYRLVTYDYFPYEVSAWDVPVWYLKHHNNGHVAVLLPYKSWDSKPVAYESTAEGGSADKPTPFRFTSTAALSTASSDEATPGEFDLLDARSLMERGDYTGAVRRTTTAIEAVVEWAFTTELRKRYAPSEAERRLKKTRSNFPERLRQWRELAQPQLTPRAFDELEAWRAIRHQIVHQSRRLSQDERGLAQQIVDTGRWFYNRVEAKPERERLRETGTALRAVGRVALAPRFPATIIDGGLVVNGPDVGTAG